MNSKEKIEATVARLLHELDELGVRDAIILYSFPTAEGGPGSFRLSWTGIGSPYGHQGMIQSYLNIDQAGRVGYEVSRQMPQPPEGEF